MSTAQEIVLIRHGETAWSKTGQHTGRTDLELTDSGRLAASALTSRLAGRSFAGVLVSPLRRAWDTCELAGLAARSEPEPDLQEWDYGRYEGRTTADIRSERPGWSIWTDGVPGGETLDEVAARADRVIARAQAMDGTVALVAHGHLLRILAARWVGAKATFGSSLALGPASISVLGHERDTPVLLHWNG